MSNPQPVTVRISPKNAAVTTAVVSTTFGVMTGIGIVLTPHIKKLSVKVDNLTKK